jgi:hypothetical protein
MFREVNLHELVVLLVIEVLNWEGLLEDSLISDAIRNLVLNIVVYVALDPHLILLVEFTLVM